MRNNLNDPWHWDISAVERFFFRSYFKRRSYNKMRERERDSLFLLDSLIEVLFIPYLCMIQMWLM